jgi:hypothetical protein
MILYIALARMGTILQAIREITLIKRYKNI